MLKMMVALSRRLRRHNPAAWPVHAWRYALAATVVAAALYVWTASPAVHAAIIIAVTVAAVAAIVVGIRTNRPASRGPWLALGAAQLLWAIGWPLWHGHILLQDAVPATDSLIIVPFLASYPLLGASLLILLLRREPDRIGLLDAAIVAAALLMIAWTALISGYVHDSAIPPLGRGFQIAYAVADVLLLAILIRLLVSKSGRPPAFSFLLMGVFTMLVSDGIWNWSTQLGDYAPGSWADIGWIFFSGLTAVAALHPSMAAISQPAPETARAFGWGSFLPLLGASLVAVGLLAYTESAGQDPVGTISLALLGGLSVVFVLVRMALIAREGSRLAERLAAQNERLHEAEELTHLGSWEWDIPTNVIALSDESYRMWGADPAEVKPSYDLLIQQVHPDDRERVQGLVQRVVETGEPAEYEFRADRLDGREVVMAARAKLLTDGSGNPVRLIGTTQDITERKEAEAERERLLLAEQAARAEAEQAHRDLRAQNERLRELDRLKDSFVASVSHELRTPLTSIRGYLDLVLDREVGTLTQEQEKFLGIVDRNANRLLRLVGDLLFVAQVDAGKLGLELAEIDLAEVLRESVEGARPHAEGKEIELAVAIESGCQVLGDHARLAQLFDNLVMNAIKFTPEGGRVGVTASTVGTCAVVEVSDTGIGISKEDQTRLFERFYRAASANEQAIPGTGLGLAIAKGIAEAHGGRIDLQSEEGVGTTFHVEMPLASTPALELEREEVAQ